MKARALKPGDRVLWSEFGHGNPTRLLEIVGQSHGCPAILYKVPDTGADTICAISHSIFDKGAWTFEAEKIRQQMEKPHRAWHQFW